MSIAEWQFCVAGKYYLSVRYYAHLLDVCEETVRRRLRNKQIPGAILENGMWMIPHEVGPIKRWIAKQKKSRKARA